MSKNKEMEESDSDSEIKTGIIEKDAWSMTVPKFLPEHNKHGMIEESKFAFLYPAYREKYLREVWPMVQKKLSEEHHLKVRLMQGIFSFSKSGKLEINRKKIIKET